MRPWILLTLCGSCALAASWTWPPPARPTPVPEAPSAANSKAVSPKPADPTPLLPLKPGLYAIIKTSMGSITAKLFEHEAPETVSTFVALANGGESWREPKTGAMVSKPLYQNLTFDHVIPNMAIQTGDPAGTGRYDCGVRTKDEFNSGLRFDRPGRMGVRNLGEPNSGGCQFFITDAPYRALNPSAGHSGYTVFGQVVDGQEVVNAISNAPSDAKDRPVDAVKLVSVTIQRVGSGPAPAAVKKPVVVNADKPFID